MTDNFCLLQFFRTAYRYILQFDIFSANTQCSKILLMFVNSLVFVYQVMCFVLLDSTKDILSNRFIIVSLDGQDIGSYLFYSIQPYANACLKL